jgi:excisionase family DNA binding protein
MIDVSKQALTVTEFCKVYGMGRATFYERVREGALRAVKNGGKTLVLKADAEAWAANLPELHLPAAEARVP